MSFLRLEDLTKNYGELIAVSDMNLEIQPGEFVSLLGPSGCGKTTTLHMIAGFAEPTSGRIEMDGRDITDLAPNARGIGIVFQSYALFPHMTVGQNVRFGLDMRRIKGSESRRRVQQALALVRLDHLSERYPRELSGGQRQRVALARALVIEPPLLLLDEPLSNLDAKLREDMQLELRAIQQQVGTTTLMVTHDQSEALSMSDRVVVMNDGRIVQVADPFEVYEVPANVFASTFVGKTNLLAAHIHAGPGGHRHITLNDWTMELPEHVQLPCGDVQLSIRPERLELALPNEGFLAGRITIRQFIGDHWLYQIECSLGRLLATYPNHGTPGLNVGDQVSVRWPPEAMHVLASDAAKES